MSFHINHNQLGHSLTNNNHDERPESSEPVDPQHWTWGQFGYRLGEEEEGCCTPVLRAKLLNHLQKNTTYKTNTMVRGGQAF